MPNPDPDGVITREKNESEEKDLVSYSFSLDPSFPPWIAKRSLKTTTSRKKVMNIFGIGPDL